MGQDSPRGQVSGANLTAWSRHIEGVIEGRSSADLKSLLVPYPSAGLTCWPASAQVGNVKNNDPSLIEPVAAA